MHSFGDAGEGRRMSEVGLEEDVDLRPVKEGIATAAEVTAAMVVRKLGIFVGNNQRGEERGKWYIRKRERD